MEPTPMQLGDQRVRAAGSQRSRGAWTAVLWISARRARR